MSLASAMFSARAVKFDKFKPKEKPPIVVMETATPELDHERRRELEAWVNEWHLPMRVTMKMIQSLVCKSFNMTMEDMVSTRRCATHAIPRHVICYLTKEYTPLSWTQIGKNLGARDHSTAMHGYRRTVERRVSDPALDSRISGIEQELHKVLQS